MKNIKKITLFFGLLIFFAACKKNVDPIPSPSNPCAELKNSVERGVFEGKLIDRISATLAAPVTQLGNNAVIKTNNVAFPFLTNDDMCNMESGLKEGKWTKNLRTYSLIINGLRYEILPGSDLRTARVTVYNNATNVILYQDYIESN